MDSTLPGQGESSANVAVDSAQATPAPEQTTPEAAPSEQPTVKVEVVEKPKLDARDEAEEASVKKQRAARDAQLKANAQVEEQRARDEKGRFAPREEKAATGGADGDGSPTAPLQAAPPVEERKFKLKVNGREVELPESEVIKRAQIAEAAQLRFQEASALYKQAQEIAARFNGTPQAQPAQGQSASPQGPDAAALARKLAYGTEAEAREAVEYLLAQRNQGPSFDPNQIALQAAAVAQQQMAYTSSLEKFGSEFKDVTDDPHLTYIAAQYFHQIKARDDAMGVQRHPYELMRDAGAATRQWAQSKLTPARTSAPNVNAESFAAKNAAKQAAPATVKPVNARANGAAAVAKTQSEIIRAERAARGLPTF